MNKHCTVMHVTGIAAGYVMMFAAMGVIAELCYKKYLNNRSDDKWFLSAFFCGIIASAFVATYLDKLLENRSSVCRKALTSFINKWPEYKGLTPQVLHGMFDELYAKRQVKNCGLTDVQAQQLVEGILALSIAAQVA